MSALRRTPIGLVVALVALLAAGCGGGSGSSDAAEVEDTITTYLAALGAGEGARACDQLTGEQARSFFAEVAASLPELQITSCSDAIEKLSGSLGGSEREALEEAEVDSVTVNGDSATATITGGTTTARLKRQGGRWYVAGGLGAAP